MSMQNEKELRFLKVFTNETFFYNNWLATSLQHTTNDFSFRAIFQEKKFYSATQLIN